MKRVLRRRGIKWRPRSEPRRLVELNQRRATKAYFELRAVPTGCGPKARLQRNSGLRYYGVALRPRALQSHLLDLQRKGVLWR